MTVERGEALPRLLRRMSPGLVTTILFLLLVFLLFLFLRGSRPFLLRVYCAVIVNVYVVLNLGLATMWRWRSWIGGCGGGGTRI